MSNRTTLTVDDEYADELEQFGDTRNEQLATVLRLAQSVHTLEERMDEMSVSGDSRERVDSTATAEDVADLRERLNELNGKIDRLPDEIATQLR